ncbi:LamB/YcsF family protein [Ureibacillus sp. Re31]|uniref:5-oxoprolinase subunit A n=1 Tax=Ureibacillus galli TaxID=2762222 RepID=A0ABR8XB91_9BACL|nr:5-oxoprolinase subunit PxpA [Ureibacillus galli]MBD8026381.1 LamB/YcsF family protein [Ureibacillus galli]
MEKPLTIDLNCDLGESFGVYKIGNDKEMMKYVSSVNVACGFHAGDASTMRKTVSLALEEGVAIGAHPGFPDLQGFGRREMNISPAEIYDITLYQISALKGFIEAEGGSLHHVKPHGALYNLAATNGEVAEAIARAIFHLDKQLILYGLAGSRLISEGKKLGLQIANEGFVDRTYTSQGQLTPRTDSNATITSEELAFKQAMKMVKEQKVVSITGEEVFVEVNTICIHGDGEKAVEFAKMLKRQLMEHQIFINSIKKDGSY